MKAEDVGMALRQLATSQKAKASSWFFKSGPGEYGYGDKFLGVTVPEQRRIAKKFKELPVPEVKMLIGSPWHEERLTGLFILVAQFKRGDEQVKKTIYELYLGLSGPVGYNLVSGGRNRGPRKIPSGIFWGINNWDLVDSSAQYIVGPWLEGKPEKMNILKKLAKSQSLWEKRIAMISTMHYINDGSSEEALVLAEKLVNDTHDLIQKAVGWMLREVGKKVSQKDLKNFLDQYAAVMPRTALRYAIEHFDPAERSYYLGLAKAIK